MHYVILRCSQYPLAWGELNNSLRAYVILGMKKTFFVNLKVKVRI